MNSIYFLFLRMHEKEECQYCFQFEHEHLLKSQPNIAVIPEIRQSKQ